MESLPDIFALSKLRIFEKRDIRDLDDGESIAIGLPQ